MTLEKKLNRVYLLIVVAILAFFAILALNLEKVLAIQQIVIVSITGLVTGIILFFVSYFKCKKMIFIPLIISMIATPFCLLGIFMACEISFSIVELSLATGIILLIVSIVYLLQRYGIHLKLLFILSMLVIFGFMIFCFCYGNRDDRVLFILLAVYSLISFIYCFTFALVYKKNNPYVAFTAISYAIFVLAFTILLIIISEGDVDIDFADIDGIGDLLDIPSKKSKKNHPKI